MTPGEEALREAMRLEQARIYGHTCPERRQPEPAAGPQLFERPADSYYGPAPTPVLAALVTAIAGDSDRAHRPGFPRVRTEQAIARGESDEDIARTFRVALADVQAVRADMDRLSA